MIPILREIANIFLIFKIVLINKQVFMYTRPYEIYKRSVKYCAYPEVACNATMEKIVTRENADRIR